MTLVRSLFSSVNVRTALNTANEIRDRLVTCLDKLSKIKPTDLVRESALGPLNFRAGVPFFERTLTLYRQVAKTDLSRSPSPILEIALGHAEESLNQFQQIEAFDPAGIDRPEQVRNLMISDVRDAHAAVYEDLCTLLVPRGAAGNQVSRGTRFPTFMILALVLLAAFLAYRSSLVERLIDDLEDSVHNFVARK